METTLNFLIGKKINISDISDVRKYIPSIVSEYCQINPNSLNLDEESMMLIIVKYGMIIIDIDMPNSNIIKLLFTTPEAGLDYLEDKDIDLDEFFTNWQTSFKSLLPLNFEIEDACITNNKGIWSDKYFFV